jgi:phosphomannomutase
MALIASISGIRGTIGGYPLQALTPVDIVRFASAYGAWQQQRTPNRTVVIGRDARPSGPMVQALVSQTLVAMGFRVLDAGLATTPTVEVEVVNQQAAGGIILTASHNPVQWNALKLLNEQGEFLSAADGASILELYNSQDVRFAEVQQLGKIEPLERALERHLEHILNLQLVDVAAIRGRKLRVAVDAVNSVGGIAVPALLRLLGVAEVLPLNCEPTGQFAHNPEPLKENLAQICDFVKANGCDLGIVVDPDVDRLALITEQGEMFGEEYTLVAVADYVLQHTPGPAVSNLSSSRALRDVCVRYGQPYTAAAVGEVNVVQEMKATGAVIGGEGNGGIIYPASHYGRDALVGIALFLTHLAHRGLSVSELRATYPNYAMCKHKVELTPQLNADEVIARLQQKHAHLAPNTIDGLKIDFEDSWVHLRKSNTEPIIRIYTEAPTEHQAQELAERMAHELQQLAALVPA